MLLVWPFLADILGIVQLKNIKVGLSGSQKMCVSSVEVTRTYLNENEEQPRGFAVRIFKE